MSKTTLIIGIDKYYGENNLTGCVNAANAIETYYLHDENEK